MKRVSTYTKQPSWEIKLKTIAQFLVEAGTIDCNPVGQRLDVGSLSKKQGIIRSIIESNDICELALRHMNTELLDVTHEYRSIDGGHRKRGILEFCNNQFETGPETYFFIDGKAEDVSGKTFGELPKVVQNAIRKYQMRFVVYGIEMTDSQAGETFRLRNLSTDVNHQEMLNSYEDNLVAKFVRETARTVLQVNNTPHQLFTLHTDSKDEIKGVYWQPKPSRLNYDEFGARFICAILKKEGITTASDDELEEMYINLGDPVHGEWAQDPAKQIAAEKALKKGLDFLLQYTETRKRNNGAAGLTLREAVMLTRLYVYFEKEFGSTWMIKDFELFYKHFKLTLDSFVGTNPTQLELVYGDTTKAKAMKGHLGVYDNKEKIQNTVDWFIEALGVPFEMIGLVVKDKVRGIDKNLRETIWLKQDKKCYVKGVPLDFADAVGAHIIPHELGGKTDASNVVVVHKKINAQMGSQNLELFKEAYLSLETA
jgi:hypothetical protein